MCPVKTPTLKAALIVIGNEILSGRTQDANTVWLAERLAGMGIILREVRIIPDEEKVIIKTVRELKKKADYVFTTGGIGPTHDDITAESMAKAFEVDLVLDKNAYDVMVKHYGSEAEMTEPRKKMAKVPRGSKLIPNPVSAAPGFIIENVYVMAGVPRIMQAMFDDIAQTLGRGQPVLSSTVTCTLAESKIAVELGRLQEQYPEVSIGSYPHYRMGVLGLSLVLRSTDPAKLEQATQGVVDIVTKNGGQPGTMTLQTGER